MPIVCVSRFCLFIEWSRILNVKSFRVKTYGHNYLEVVLDKNDGTLKVQVHKEENIILIKERIIGARKMFLSSFICGNLISPPALYCMVPEALTGVSPLSFYVYILNKKNTTKGKTNKKTHMFYLPQIPHI